MGMIACSTVGTAPLDDAYYWETSVPSAPSAPSQPTQTTQTTKTTIEYLSVQDTTVTIRIHK